MERKKYRWCVVPQCRNTSVTTPTKIFIDVPRKADVRKKWLDLAKRKFDGMSATSPIYFCEDHFDLPNDMENYMRYHLMGFVHRIMLKPGCLPSKFQYISHPDAIEESNTEKENTTLPLNIECKAVSEEYQPKVQDKCVQALIKSKTFKSKFTQTDT